MKKQEVIILVHGFNKNGSDMLTLKKYLAAKGYYCQILDLPTRYKTVKECSSILKKELEKLISSAEYQRIHFVGHSMGGLIIMDILQNIDISKIGRCVFIAVPFKGTPLADLVYKYFPPVLWIIRSLRDLRTNSIPIPSEDGISYPDIGVIAGNKCNLLLGKLLKQESDGRVEVEATEIRIMKDFTVQPYGHKEIHHRQDIAELVDNFLTNGKFFLV